MDQLTAARAAADQEIARLQRLFADLVDAYRRQSTLGHDWTDLICMNTRMASRHFSSEKLGALLSIAVAQSASDQMTESSVNEMRTGRTVMVREEDEDMDGVVAQIKAAIDETEQDAAKCHRLNCKMVCTPGFGARCTCGEPQRRRDMVASHRKILALHDSRIKTREGRVDYYCPVCGGRDWDLDSLGDKPCETVLALADAYGIEA